MRRRNEQRPLETHKAKNKDKKCMYTITILTPDDQKAYLKGLPDGNYEVISTIVGAALWKSKLLAVLANEEFFDGGGTVEEVDMSHLTYVKRSTKEKNFVVTTAKITK
jgi:hypothetical protein